MRGPLEDNIGLVSSFSVVFNAEAVGTRENVNSAHGYATKVFTGDKVTSEEELIQLHVTTKNAQSTRDVNRNVDFATELADCGFDIIFLTGTWRRTSLEGTTSTHRLEMAPLWDIGAHLLAKLVLEHDLKICSRTGCADDSKDSWTGLAKILLMEMWHN